MQADHPSFRVQAIDHVEFFVPDRHEAARWYEAVMGLTVVKRFEVWAEGDGPLMISSDDGQTKLALFQGNPQDKRPTAGFHRVAFRVDGPGFLEFLDRLAQTPVSNPQGELVTPQHVVDHALAWSIYFCDPWCHRLEVTTYDYDWVAARLTAPE